MVSTFHQRYGPWAVVAGAQEPQSISDAEMALGYYQPLAEQGEPYAQLTIGEIYMEGAGVEQDLIQAELHVVGTR